MEEQLNDLEIETEIQNKMCEKAKKNTKFEFYFSRAKSFKNVIIFEILLPPLYGFINIC